jgi:hypothetical protein
MSVLPPVAIAKSQLPQFKTHANALCEALSLLMKTKQWRGNKALNLYARLCGYASYQAVKIKAQSVTLPKGEGASHLSITTERRSFMLVTLMHEFKLLIKIATNATFAVMIKVQATLLTV